MELLKPDTFIPLARPFASEREIEAVIAVLKSGWWSTGPGVQKFEEEVCEYLGGEGLKAVGLSSCTAGLFLSLKALGIGPGDEVLLPTLTFAATSHVVEWCGATPVLCDIDPATLNISVASLQDRISSRTKAVIPVHVAGYPCEMGPILDFSRSNGLGLIEDAAHAIGTEYAGKKIGRHGDSVVFSFYATKNLACGEGGMVVSSQEKLIEEVRSLSYFGIDKKAYQEIEGRDSWYYQIKELGYKFNLDQIHAAIGRVQLQYLEAKNTRRRQIAHSYDNELPQHLKRPLYEPAHTHARHLYPILLPENMDRDQFISALKEKGVGCSVHFIPLHRHDYFSGKWKRNQFPGAESIADGLVSLPLFPEMEDSFVERVVKAVQDVWEDLK